MFEKEIGECPTWINKGLADCLYEGDGCVEDKIAAVSLYLDVIVDNPNNAEALERLGESYMFGYGVCLDWCEAIKYFEKAIANGNDWSKYRFAHIYASGKHGIPVDTEKAIDLFTEFKADNTNWEKQIDTILEEIKNGEYDY